MKRIIPYSQRYEFDIKIQSSKNGKIMIGVVSQYRVDERRSYDSGKAVCYYGYNGWICENSSSKSFKSQGNGFKEGNTVSIAVELDKGFI